MLEFWLEEAACVSVCLCVCVSVCVPLSMAFRAFVHGNPNLAPITGGIPF